MLKFQNLKMSLFHKGVRQTNIVVLTFVFLQVYGPLRDIFVAVWWSSLKHQILVNSGDVFSFSFASFFN